MISGTVTNALEAVVRLRVHGPTGAADIDAVVDTGYDGFLALPPDVVARLGLPRQSSVRVVYADGSHSWCGIYTAEVEWDGVLMDTSVTAVGGDPLLGMGLLYGHDLHVQAVPGGVVEIRPTP